MVRCGVTMEFTDDACLCLCFGGWLLLRLLARLLCYSCCRADERIFQWEGLDEGGQFFGVRTIIL